MANYACTVHLFSAPSFFVGKIGVLWHTVTRVDRVVCDDTHLCTMTHSDTRWPTVMRSDTQWRAMTHNDAWWQHAVAAWNCFQKVTCIIVFGGWHTVMRDDPQWRTVTHGETQSHIPFFCICVHTHKCSANLFLMRGVDGGVGDRCITSLQLRFFLI